MDTERCYLRYYDLLQSKDAGRKTLLFQEERDVLKHGDDVFVIGSALAIEQLFRLFGIFFNTHLERVIIVGASAIGIELARVLEGNGTDVKLIEPR